MRNEVPSNPSRIRVPFFLRFRFNEETQNDKETTVVLGYLGKKSPEETTAH